MGEDVAAWCAELTRQEVAARTLRAYRSDLTCFARWFESTNDEPLTALAVTRTDLRDYRVHLQTVAGASPATVNRRLAALRKFLGWAHATGRISENPAVDVRGVSAMPTSPRSLPKRDVDRLVRAVERAGVARDLAIVMVLRHTGLRVGELSALRLGDVALSERKGMLTVRAGKGGKFRRVPLNADARRVLTAYLSVRPPTTDDHVFIGQRGTALQPQGVELMLRKYARVAGVEATPHTIRHSFARQSLDAGVDLVTLASLLGHEQLQTTARYTQPSVRDLEEAVERLATL